MNRTAPPPSRYALFLLPLVSGEEDGPSLGVSDVQVLAEALDGVLPLRRDEQPSKVEFTFVVVIIIRDNRVLVRRVVEVQERHALPVHPVHAAAPSVVLDPRGGQ